MKILCEKNRAMIEMRVQKVFPCVICLIYLFSCVMIYDYLNIFFILNLIQGLL